MASNKISKEVISKISHRAEDHSKEIINRNREENRVSKKGLNNKVQDHRRGKPVTGPTDKGHRNKDREGSSARHKTGDRKGHLHRGEKSKLLGIR